MKWTREEFEGDKRRFEALLADYRARGLSDEHPLIERQLRRIETVNRVLTDPAYGLVDDK